MAARHLRISSRVKAFSGWPSQSVHDQNVSTNQASSATGRFGGVPIGMVVWMAAQVGEHGLGDVDPERAEFGHPAIVPAPIAVPARLPSHE